MYLRGEDRLDLKTYVVKKIMWVKLSIAIYLL